MNSDPNMKMNSEMFANALLELVNSGRSLKVIEDWATSVMLQYDLDPPELRSHIVGLMAMSMGPEFEYSLEELRDLALTILQNQHGDELNSDTRLGNNPDP
jgi:hypothetical protein